MLSRDFLSTFSTQHSKDETERAERDIYPPTKQLNQHKTIIDQDQVEKKKKKRNYRIPLDLSLLVLPFSFCTRGENHLMILPQRDFREKQTNYSNIVETIFFFSLLSLSLSL